MPITIKADPKIDNVISRLDFFDQPAYAIEIYSIENIEPSYIRKAIQGLVVALGMGGTFCEFEVDFDVEDKVRVTGNISQAMLKFRENNDAILLFSTQLLSDIEKHEKLQEMLQSSKDFYSEKNNTSEDDDSPSLTSIRSSFKTFKPREETKENNDNLKAAGPTIVQSKTKGFG